MSTSPPDFSGFTYSGPSSSSSVSASDSTGDQGVLSGLSDIFSSVGAAVSSGIKASNAPMGPIATPQGTLVYNPATGTYQSSVGITAQSTMTPLLLLLGLGIVAYILMKK